jgi:glycosyltransferase involved in cell wall biosynthesis
VTSAPVRICHVTPHLPPDQAANALLPATLGAWSRAHGDTVTFVAHEPAQGGRPDDHVLAGPVEWVPRRVRAGAVRRFLRIGTVRSARQIGAALDAAAAGADLLHLHSNGLIIEVASAWARRRHVPTVLTLYGTEIWHYRPRRFIDPFRRAFDAAAEVTFYSLGLLEHARSLGLDRTGVSVVYPVVSELFAPLDAYERAALRRGLGIEEPHVILNVKRLHDLAAQDVLIDAFARLARTRPVTRLVICGAGPARADLEARARRHGVADRVTFTGLVTNDQVARFAAAADVFALPSRLEALPTVAVEALAAGTPVVSADHPGGLELHALFGDDVRIVPREAVEPLAEALGDAIDHPRRTTDATRALVHDRFGPDAIRDAYAAVYARAHAR